MTWNSQIIKNLIVLLTFFLIQMSDIFADDINLRPENFTHLTIEDGLPQNNVRCIEEDQYGFLWLCTNDGLVRYDGYEFELVTEGTDGSRISNTIVRTILADGDNLWIGTDKGLNRFDLKKGVFELIKLNSNGNSDSNMIRSLLKVTKGELWIGTRGGIYVLDYSKKETTHAISINDEINARYMTLVNGSILIANYGSGIVEMNAKTRKMTAKESLGEGGAKNLLNISLYDDKIYVSTYGGGLFILDLKFKILKHFKSCENQNKNCLSSNFIFFAKNYNKKIWIGSYSGFNILDPINLKINKTVLLTSSIKNKYISDSIISAYFSKKYLWFGLGPGGLIKYKKSLNGVNYYRPNYNENIRSSSDKSVFAVTKLGKDIFAGTYSGLYKVNQTDNKLDPIEVINSKLNESSLRISSLCVINDSDILLGTAGGLYLYDTSRGKLNKIQLGKNINSIITAISCNKNRVIIAEKSGAIYLYHRDDNTYTKLKSDKLYFHVYSISDSGALYFATTFGMKIVDLIDNKLTERKTISPDKYITKAIIAGKLIILGTFGDGLYVWEKQTDIVTKIPLAYNTIGNSAYDIVVIDGDAWISTNNGIIQLELDTYKYSHYVQSHGIGDKEYSAGGLFYDELNNTLYAGGLTGLTSIKLVEFKNIARSTDNILSKISIINKDGITLRHFFNIPQSIMMSEGDTLIIDLGNKDAAIRSKSNFTYKIEKTVSTSISVLRANQRQISLVDIANSDFKLSFGEGNNYVLAVEVTPYIWKRWWSYLIYIIMVYLLVKYFLSQYKSIQDTKNRDILSRKELGLKRKQLASLSHELRTPLNAIIGITEATSSKDSDIQHIKSSANLLRSLIDNALDSVSFEMNSSICITETALNIRTIIEDVIEILNLYILSSNIKISIDIESSVPELIRSDKTKIQQIILNLIKNALKHSKTASSIKISISVEDSELLISVDDDGIGIDYPEQKAIFDVFYKVENKNSGFGLGLYISKLLSKALGGDLILDSELGNGCRFTLNIPVKIDNELSVIEKNIKVKSKIKIKNLLVLEDDPLNIFTIKLQLKNLGVKNYRIVENYNQYSKENKLEYDCIILDLNFDHEVFDGIELAKNLKKSNYPGLIYILTAETDALIKADAKKYVIDYLVKPISLKDLESILFLVE